MTGAPLRYNTVMKPLLPALLVVASAGFVAPLHAQPPKSAVVSTIEGVTTLGSGSATYRVTEAQVWGTMDSSRETALRDALGRFGIKGRDISRPTPNQPTWNIIVRKLDQARTVAEAVASVGMTETSVHYVGRSSDMDRARRAARRTAAEDARREATEWAEAAGARLGKPLGIEPQSGKESVGPSDDAGPGAPPTEVIITEVVKVRFALE